MSQDNSSEINEKDKLTPEEVQSLELDVPAYLRRGLPKPKMIEPVENRNKLTPKQANLAERKDPEEAQQLKTKLRDELVKRIEANPGGIASELDPINYNDVTKGQPTIPYKPDPNKISNN